ncbi:hypothetical protein G9465_22430 (plasmid) [Haloarcula sp. JP-L23]|nr:hypothetical protein G9465_22430 [Haloarcula sp. JP-L23]
MGVLNKTTKTVHKHKIGNAKLQTTHGLTYHVAPDKLRMTSVESATTEFNATKCGRCFEDAGGY